MRLTSILSLLAAAALTIPTAASANPAVVGCSDDSREGFTDRALYRIIAACGGAWAVPGAFHSAPACGRAAGNDGANQSGQGCNVEDLCATGWHVCYGPDDIEIRTGGRGCQDAVSATYPNHNGGTPTVATTPGGAFFMTRTSGSGVGNCDEVVNGFPQSFNDIFGCGNMGAPPQANCAPLNRFGHNQCSALASSALGGTPASAFGYLANEFAWYCNDGGGGINESKSVTKSRAGDQGGVLCCKNTDSSLPEICDGIDNNENGTIDETDFDRDGAVDDVPGGPCTTSGGQAGTIACTGSGGWTCVAVPPEACCLSDGSCADFAPSACGARAGVSQGRNSSCASLSGACPQPTGSCCFADGGCQELSRGACLDASGSPGRTGSTCAAAQCQPVADGSIRGRLWHDADADGLEDAGEPGLAGVSVTLTGAGRDLNTLTSADGSWKFDALIAGTWRVGVDHTTDAVLLAGPYRPTIQRAGNNSDLWSVTAPVTLVLPQSGAVSGVDLGFITGCIGADADGDGICDSVDDCFDLDGDGYGVGIDCRGDDCDETFVNCNVDCLTDRNGGDGNGVPDCQEATCLDNDGDGYGVGDGCAGSDCNDDEALCVTQSDCGDADRDTTPNCIDDDDDNDGVPDRTEELLGSDPLKEDSDGDGLSDGDEVNVYFTDPTEADTDKDGASDSVEVASGTSPTDPEDTPPNTPPVTPDGDADANTGTGTAERDDSGVPSSGSSESCGGGSLPTGLGLAAAFAMLGLVTRRRRARLF